MDYHDDRFEWDKQKAATNLRNHGVSFEAARLAFDEPNSVDIHLPDDGDGEVRWKQLCLGLVGVLVVIYTEREGDDGLTRTRIISVWKANKHEQARYTA